MITQSDDVIASDFYADQGGSAMVERTIARYGLSGTSPTAIEEYWGDVRITATDYASVLDQALSSPVTGTG